MTATTRIEHGPAPARTAAELVADPWAFGPWCFVIDEVRRFPIPLPARGMQGWWPVPVEGPGTEVFGALDALVPEHAAARPGRGWSALTLLQPYASAIVDGGKRIENRPQRRTIPQGGIWLGLHAGKLPYERRLSDVLTVTATGLLDRWRTPAEDGAQALEGYGLWPEAPRFEELPLGAMLGAFHLAACLRYPDPMTEEALLPLAPRSR